jgi:hypothetical protein
MVMDGWTFFVNGSTFKPTASKATSKLYRSTGEGKFADASANAGVARAGWGSGVCAGDYDGDGTTVIRGELRDLGGADEIEFGVEYQKSLGFAEVMYNGMDGDCDAEDDGAGLI